MEGKKEKSIRKYTFRGKNMEQLISMEKEDLFSQFRTRIRRKFRRGLGHKFTSLVQKIRKSKKNCQPGEKPKAVKTHLRNAVVLPEMVGAVLAIHQGNAFNNVEVKFDMVGRYLGEFALSYKPTKHGRPGIGATKGSQHVDKK